MVSDPRISDARLIAVWFDYSRTASQIAADFDVNISLVYECWNRAKRKGQLPKGARHKGGNIANPSPTVLDPDTEPLPFDRPLTVGSDKLLVRLRKKHGDDPARALDDLTEKLNFIQLSMTRGKRKPEFAS